MHLRDSEWIEESSARIHVEKKSAAKVPGKRFRLDVETIETSRAETFTLEAIGICRGKIVYPVRI